MLKELLARVIQPTNDTVIVESVEPEDIHEKIRKAVLKFLTDAGFPNLTVEIGPQGGCTHDRCTFESSAYWTNIPPDTATEVCETFHTCARSAAIIIFSEILGTREILDENYSSTIDIVDNK
jgi:hypothetical protein